MAEPPSTSHALAGATVIANLSASNETVSKDDYRMLLVKSASARLLCGYIYTSAGEGESTQDLVFGGHDLIAENGTLLVQSSRFSSGIVYADLDVLRIVNERRRMGTFGQKPEKDYRVALFRKACTDPVGSQICRTSFCAGGSCTSKQTVRGYFVHSGIRTEETVCAYRIKNGGSRNLRRIGFHIGTAGDGAYF